MIITIIMIIVITNMHNANTYNKHRHLARPGLAGAAVGGGVAAPPQVLEGPPQ